MFGIGLALTTPVFTACTLPPPSTVETKPSGPTYEQAVASGYQTIKLMREALMELVLRDRIDVQTGIRLRDQMREAEFILDAIVDTPDADRLHQVSQMLIELERALAKEAQQ